MNSHRCPKAIGKGELLGRDGLRADSAGALVDVRYVPIANVAAIIYAAFRGVGVEKTVTAINHTAHCENAVRREDHSSKT